MVGVVAAAVGLVRSGSLMNNGCGNWDSCLILRFDEGNGDAFYAAGGSVSPIENTGNIFENGAVKVNGKLAYPAYGNIDGSEGTLDIVTGKQIGRAHV